MNEGRRLEPPDRLPPEGTIGTATSGRLPRPDDEAEAEAIARAREDRIEAATRRDPDRPRRDIDAVVEDHAEDDGVPAASLLHHLDELRTRILRSVIAILLGAGVGWWFSGQALEWAIRHTVGTVVVLDPLESFSERFKLALILGGLVALPLVLYQAWAFVLPGLFRRERRLLLPLVFGSIVLFLAGASTAVFLVVPIVLEVLETFQTASMVQQIRLSSLLGFVYNLGFATGVVFQLPLVAGALAALRIVTSRWLLRQWRVAIVSMLVVSALITPGDVVTAQIILGIPLVLLYLLSIVVAWLVERLRKDAEPDTAEESP